MKTLLTLALLTLASLASAQSYSVTSHTIDGGGGTSSGGAYAITGAIAQHDASAASTGGTYSISGGFFGQYMALQQTGAPHVIIRGVGANVQVVWGSNVPGWKLQANSTDLANAGWLDVVGTPTVSGPEQFLQFAAAAGACFSGCGSCDGSRRVRPGSQHSASSTDIGVSRPHGLRRFVVLTIGCEPGRTRPLDCHGKPPAASGVSLAQPLQLP